MRPISASTRVSRKGARFSFVDNSAIFAYIEFKERLPVNGSPFPVISDQSLVPVASALFLLPFQRLTRSKHTADTEADPIFAKRLTIPPLAAKAEQQVIRLAAEASCIEAFPLPCCRLQAAEPARTR